MLRQIQRYSTAAPKRVAVVGSGPAAFYTAHHLFKSGANVAVDFYERLPAPFGLLRYGVAPDHPEVKNCEEYLDNLMDNHGDRVRFFGNTEIGSDVSLLALRQAYHGVVLSYGCTLGDNLLGVEGENLKGVVSARQFVNWYNSHPDFADWTPPDLSKISNVTIVGNGNVALDVARVLLASPKHWLPTDISPRCVDALAASIVSNVAIVARRGLMQLAFSNKEIRELLEVSKAEGIHFEIDQALLEAAKPATRVEKRRVATLTKYVGINAGAPRQWSLDYCLSPKRFIALAENPQAVAETEFEVNEVVDGKVVPTGATVRRPNELVITLIGYRGSAIDLELEMVGNHLSHVRGRVAVGGAEIPGLYCSGWIKTGPQGVIATTMMDSFDTADQILADLASGVCPEPSTDVPMPANAVDWAQWQKLNQYELETGAAKEKTRLKVDNFPQMLEVAK